MKKYKEIEMDRNPNFPYLNLKDVTKEIISKNKKLEFDEVYGNLCDFLELKAGQLMNEYDDEIVLFFKKGVLRQSCVSINLLKYNKKNILTSIEKVLGRIEKVLGRN